jgi:SAM-dependent methyltransferase
VLDMCAGSGHLTGLCIALGARVWAVEEDPAAVAYLAGRMKGLRKLWQVEPGKWVADMVPYTRDRTGPDGEPLPKMAFQAIISHPLHHAQFDIALTRALWPFIAPGGVLATVICADSWGGDHARCGTFREWCDEILADVISIGDELFHAYGDLNDACLFVGTKPVPEPAA